MSDPSYRSTQAMTLLWIMLPTATIASATGVFLGTPADLSRVAGMQLAVFSAILLVLGRLVIELDDEELRWSFGFVGWPRWRLPLRDIASVEVAESTWLEGWGIRRTRQGWLYNAWGRRCLRLVRHDGKVTRLGCADPERLRAYIEARLPRRR
jgi:hypothetical protein